MEFTIPEVNSELGDARGSSTWVLSLYVEIITSTVMWVPVTKAWRALGLRITDTVSRYGGYF